MRGRQNSDDPSTERSDTATMGGSLPTHVEPALDDVAATIKRLATSVNNIIAMVQRSTSTPSDELRAELVRLRTLVGSARFGFKDAHAEERLDHKTAIAVTEESTERARLTLAVDKLFALVTSTHPVPIRGLGIREIPNLSYEGLRDDAVLEARSILALLSDLEKRVRRVAERSGDEFEKRMQMIEGAMQIPALAHLFATYEILCRPKPPDRSPFAAKALRNAITIISRAHEMTVFTSFLDKDLPAYREWSEQQKKEPR